MLWYQWLTCGYETQLTDSLGMILVSGKSSLTIGHWDFLWDLTSHFKECPECHQPRVIIIMIIIIVIYQQCHSPDDLPSWLRDPGGVAQLRASPTPSAVTWCSSVYLIMINDHHYPYRLIHDDLPEGIFLCCGSMLECFPHFLFWTRLESSRYYLNKFKLALQTTPLASLPDSDKSNAHRKWKSLIPW